MSKSGKLELIIGPMFSGKSSELIRKIRILKCINRKILVVKPKIDNRYHQHKIVSHNKDSEDCIIVDNLKDLDNNVIIDYQVIVIDEAQLFNDLKKYVLFLVENLNLHVIIGGLDGDYKREPFGEILNLIPYADDYKKLTAMCNKCNDETPAIFTKRIINNNDQIFIGTDCYIPLCRYHYINS
jgi:thymidine kinase